MKYLAPILETLPVEQRLLGLIAWLVLSRGPASCLVAVAALSVLPVSVEVAVILATLGAGAAAIRSAIRRPSPSLE